MLVGLWRTRGREHRVIPHRSRVNAQDPNTARHCQPGRRAGLVHNNPHPRLPPIAEGGGHNGWLCPGHDLGRRSQLGCKPHVVVADHVVVGVEVCNHRRHTHLYLHHVVGGEVSRRAHLLRKCHLGFKPPGAEVVRAVEVAAAEVVVVEDEVVSNYHRRKWRNYNNTWRRSRPSTPLCHHLHQFRSGLARAPCCRIPRLTGVDQLYTYQT